MFSIFKKKQPLSEDIKHTQTSYDFGDVSIIANYFKDTTGVTFDKQTSILKNKVSTFCKLRAISSFNELLSRIKTNADINQELIDYLTTNETFFYREFKQVQELTELIKQKGQKVEILCAPSSTGEEPYSIAVALLEAGVSHENFNITGIDINSEAIEKAKEGRYRDRNVRNLSDSIIGKYFNKDGDYYVLSDKIRSKVDFKVVNIFDPSFAQIGRFDYIFSRNMLIYFDKETKQKAKTILEGLRKNKEQEIFFGHADLF